MEHLAFVSLEGKSSQYWFSNLPTPSYIIEEGRLLENAKILEGVIRNTGCKILLAQKAFSNYDFYPLLSPFISGTEASGLYEARLGAEEMPGKEVHVFCAAYRDDEFEQILNYADHIVFNSVTQLKRFGLSAKKQGKSIGIRINPECSTQDGKDIYDPCASGSRLGVTRSVWEKEMTEEWIQLLDGLHFHTLCEQNVDALETTIEAVEEKFGDILQRIQWLNMGGGHHITREDYDVARLEQIIQRVQTKWKVSVYLEPGEAVALNAGYLVCRILDIVQNGNVKNAILDVSAACHMPDVIEMPYHPPLYGSSNGGKDEFMYRLTGPTCLSGDIIGDYYFSDKLKINDILVFGDMAIYSMCKNNTFNGMPLPNIYRKTQNHTFEKLTDFGYSDFKMRLGKRKEETY